MLKTNERLADNTLIINTKINGYKNRCRSLKREKRGFCERIGYIGQGIEPN